MGILLWILIGVIVDALTLVIEPYVNRRHIPATIILGIVGAILGGSIGSFLGFDETDGMQFMVVLLSIAGAVFFLTWYRAIEKFYS